MQSIGHTNHNFPIVCNTACLNALETNCAHKPGVIIRAKPLSRKSGGKISVCLVVGGPPPPTMLCSFLVHTHIPTCLWLRDTVYTYTTTYLSLNTFETLATPPPPSSPAGIGYPISSPEMWVLLDMHALLVGPIGISLCLMVYVDMHALSPAGGPV